MGNNNIEDIKIFGNININKIEILELKNNKILNIAILKKINLKNLNTLDISHNYIKSIRPLENLNISLIGKIIINNNSILNNLQKTVDILVNLRRKINYPFYLSINIWFNITI